MPLVYAVSFLFLRALRHCRLFRRRHAAQICSVALPIARYARGGVDTLPPMLFDMRAMRESRHC